MKFHLFKQNEEGEFKPFVTLWIEAETPEGQEDNPYDYLNTLVAALADAYRSNFRWQDEKGKQSRIFQKSNALINDPITNYLFDQVEKEIKAWNLWHGDPKSKSEFPGLDDIIKTGYKP